MEPETNGGPTDEELDAEETELSEFLTSPHRATRANARERLRAIHAERAARSSPVSAYADAPTGTVRPPVEPGAERGPTPDSDDTVPLPDTRQATNEPTPGMVPLPRDEVQQQEPQTHADRIAARVRNATEYAREDARHRGRDYGGKVPTGDDRRAAFATRKILQPQFTGLARDYPEFRTSYAAYLAHYDVHWNEKTPDSIDMREAYAVLRDATRTVQRFPSHVELAGNTSRLATYQIVEQSGNAKTALERLDMRFGFAANDEARNLAETHLHRITMDSKQSIEDFYTIVDHAVYELRRLGGAFTDEQHVNLLERAATKYWRLQIQLRKRSARSVDELYMLLKQQAQLDASRAQLHTAKDVNAAMLAATISPQDDNADDDTVLFAKREFACWYCGQIGHRQNDKKPNGTFRCSKRAADVAAGRPSSPASYEEGLKVARVLFACADCADAHEEVNLVEETTEDADPDDDAECYAAAIDTAVQRGEWILDSGASAHITGDESLFMPGSTSMTQVRVRGASGATTRASHKGEVRLRLQLIDNTYSEPITLGNVLYVPGCRANIISKNLLARRVRGSAMNRDSFVQTPTMFATGGMQIRVHQRNMLDTVFAGPSVDDAPSSRTDAHRATASPADATTPIAYVGVAVADDAIAYKDVAKDPQLAIGHRFTRVFDDGTHASGLIISYDPTARYWLGQYDVPQQDGELPTEDFNTTEVLKWIATARRGIDADHSDTKVHTVANLLQKRTVGNRREYLVDWGPPWEPTWEPTANLRGFSRAELARVPSTPPPVDTPAYQQHVSRGNKRVRLSRIAASTGGDEADAQAGGDAPDDHAGGAAPDAKAGGDAPGGTAGGAAPGGKAGGAAPDSEAGGAALNDQAGGDVPVEDATKHASCDDDAFVRAEKEATRDPFTWSHAERANMLAHITYGHAGRHVLKYMQDSGLIADNAYFRKAAMPACFACARAAAERRDDRSNTHASCRPTLEAGEQLQADYVHFATTAHGGATGAIIVVDTKTNYATVGLMKRPGDLQVRLQEAVNFWRARRATVRTLRSDRGSNLISGSTAAWLAREGIEQQPSIAYEHQQAGGVEATIKLVKRLARAWIAGAAIDAAEFIGYALSAAAVMLNRIPRRVLDWRVPLTIVSGAKPDNTNMGVFGAECFVLRDASTRNKAEDHAVKGIYLGMDGARHTAEPGHLVLNVQTNQVLSSRHVKHVPDRILARAQKDVLGKDDLAADPGDATRIAAVYALRDFVQGEREVVKDPHNRRAMLAGPHAAEFVEGEQEELSAIARMNAYDLVDESELPSGTVVLDSTWAYKYKTDPVTGDITRYKARLAVRGDQEPPDPDRPTFSAQVSGAAVRVLIAAMAAGRYKYSAKGDVGNAYLETPARRDVYVRQAPGYDDGTGRVMHLKCNWYGVDDAGRQFWKHLDSILCAWGERSDADPCVYVKRREGRATAVVATFVDDLFVLGETKDDVDGLFAALTAFSRVKREDEPTSFLGLEITRRKTGIHLRESVYVEQICRRFADRTLPKHRATPMRVERADEGSAELERRGASEFRSVLGALMYLAHMVRPDISYAVNHLARNMSVPTEADDVELNRVLAYVADTPRAGVWYPRSADLVLRVYADADHAAAPMRKSHTGIVWRLAENGGAVDWVSARQRTVTRSSTEAEIMALSEADRRTTTLRRLLAEIGVQQQHATKIFEDNKATIDIVNASRYTSRTRHIDVHLRAVRERARAGAVEIQWVPTSDQVADVLTKPLTQPQHALLTGRIMGTDLADTTQEGCEDAMGTRA